MNTTVPSNRQVFIAWIVLLAALAMAKSSLGGTTIYKRFVDLEAQGSWIDSDDGLFRVFPDELMFDLNRDGETDLLFRHVHVPRTVRVDPEGVELLRIADQGISENLRILRGMRGVAIDSANEGINDEDALFRNQRLIDNSLEMMERISASASTDGKPVLDGSLGLQGVASHESIVPISASPETTPGSYSVNIVTPGERAVATARTTQTGGLAQNETIVVNWVSIELVQNMNKVQVVDRINDYSLQTGVIADFPSWDEPTRLYTKDFGSQAEVQVISNTAAAVDSSGFGKATTRAKGRNVVGIVGGNTYTGRGQNVTASTGPEDGIAFRVSPSMDPTVTVSGPVGTVEVTDNSPEFVLDSKTMESISPAFPNLRPEALGRGIVSNSFVSLADITVLSARQANDALEVIDSTYDDLMKIDFETSDLRRTQKFSQQFPARSTSEIQLKYWSGIPRSS